VRLMGLRGPVEHRRRAENEYRSSFAALWHAAEGAGVPDVVSALKRFAQAAVALSLTKPEPINGPWGSTSGWSGRTSLQTAEAPLPECPECGGEVKRKPPWRTGMQRRYCSGRCMRRAVQRRHRDKQRGQSVQPARILPSRPRQVVPVIRGCNHAFIVLRGSDLAARRTAAGWPAYAGRRLDQGMPHLCCAACLRTYSRIKQADHQVGKIGDVMFKAQSNGRATAQAVTA